MLTADRLSDILENVYQKAAAVFSGSLEAVILYGSYARGDYDAGSDVDIMIVADLKAEDTWKYRKEFAKFTSRLGLENDIVISVIIRDSETLHKYENDLPFYRNILKEGVRIAV